MDFEKLFEALGIGGTGVAMTLGVLALFWKADEGFSEEFRAVLADRLQTAQTPTHDRLWAQTFLALFDSIFDENPRSTRRVVRSCLSSLIVFVILTFTVLFQASNLSMSIIVSIAVVACSWSLTYNFYIDYWSLIQSRWIIGCANRFQIRLFIPVLLFLDFILTTLIAFSGIIALLLISWFFTPLHSTLGLKTVFTTLDPYFLNQLNSMGIELSVVGWGAAISLCTTYFTSVWVWLYITGWLCINLFSMFEPLVRLLRFILPIRSHPMRAIGEVAAMITGLSYLVLTMLA